MASKNGILLESGTNEMELLAIQLDGQIFGVNVAKVQAIVQFDPSQVTALPKAPDGLMGMLLYRDKTIPLINLAQVLKLNANTTVERPVVVVTEFNNTVTSFRVDGVERIHRVSWSRFEPATSVFANANITGTVTIEDVDIMVLDMEQIITGFFPNLNFEELQEEICQQAQEFSRESLKIYFAEDSVMIRKHVVNALRKVGIGEVVAFENGLQAYKQLSAMDKNDDLPQLLITDIEMPQMDGLTLCRKIRETEALKDIPVIIFSSLVNDQMITKCRKVGANAWITKPELNQLIKLVDEICQVRKAA